MHSAPTTPVNCVLAPARFCHRGARRAAADRKALKQPRGHVRRTEGDHLLVLIDFIAAAQGEGARQHARVGKGDQGNRDGAGRQRGQIAGRHKRDLEGGQALRQRSHDRNAGRRRQVEHAHDDRRADHGDQHAGNLGPPALEDQDDGQARSADRKGRPIGHALRNTLHQADRFLNQIVPARREAQQFGQLTDDDGERDAVQIAQADRLGEQIRDETEACQPGENAQRRR